MKSWWTWPDSAKTLLDHLVPLGVRRVPCRQGAESLAAAFPQICPNCFVLGGLPKLLLSTLSLWALA